MNRPRTRALPTLEVLEDRLSLSATSPPASPIGEFASTLPPTTKGTLVTTAIGQYGGQEFGATVSASARGEPVPV